MQVGVSRVPCRRWVVFAVAFAGTVAHVASAAAYIILVPARRPRLPRRRPLTDPRHRRRLHLHRLRLRRQPGPTPNDAIFAGITTARRPDRRPAVRRYAAEQLVLQHRLVGPGRGGHHPGDEFVLSRRPDTRRRTWSRTPATPQSQGALALSRSAARALAGARCRRGAHRRRSLARDAARLLTAARRGRQHRPVPAARRDRRVVALLFGLVGIVYGRRHPAPSPARRRAELMAEGIRQMAPVLVLFFAIAQFLAYFDWTRIGDVLAVNGAEAAEAERVPIVVVFLLSWSLLTLVNIMVTSGSAMWALVAPVLVPMLMLVDVPPETTQAAVPHRRLGLHRHHPDEPLLRDGAGLPPALPARTPASARSPPTRCRSRWCCSWSGLRCSRFGTPSACRSVPASRCADRGSWWLRSASATAASVRSRGRRAASAPRSVSSLAAPPRSARSAPSRATGRRRPSRTARPGRGRRR